MAMTTGATSTPSTTAFSYLQAKNKIGGLVSGIDVNAVMEKLMKAEHAQMEKLQQQKQKYEWKRDAYREVNTKLQTFSDNAFDNYGLSKNWNVRSVTNEGAGSVKVTAGTDATGNLTVESATKATSAQVTSTNNGLAKTAKIADLGLSLVDGKGSFTMSSIGKDGKLSNIATIEYTESDTLESLAKKINGSKAGVTALVTDGQFSLSANSTGRASDSAADIAVLGDAAGIFDKIGFNSGGAADFGLANNGKDATAKINGIELTSSTNQFTVAGYTLELNSNVNTPFNISSSTDKEGAVKKVKEFISSYNELIKSLNTSVIQKKNIDFSPLTDAQKAEMTDSEIAKWEEKAKNGLLKNDPILRKTVSEFRASIYSSTDKDKATLAKIGITTTATYNDGGQLELNEEKLLAALEKDPDILSKVFTGDTGVISTMRDSAKDAISNIKRVAGNEATASEKTYSIGRDISGLDARIENWKDRLKGVEERYWNQFSAMELAVQKANSQSSIFTAG